MEMYFYPHGSAVVMGVEWPVLRDSSLTLRVVGTTMEVQKLRVWSEMTLWYRYCPPGKPQVEVGPKKSTLIQFTSQIMKDVLVLWG